MKDLHEAYVDCIKFNCEKRDLIEMQKYGNLTFFFTFLPDPSFLYSVDSVIITH